MKLNEYLLFNKITSYKEVILEYGSGGSTIQLLKRKKKIYSVESNTDFYNYLNSISLIKKYNGKSLFLKIIDLGNTNSWGRPLSLEKKESWHYYYTEVWKNIDQNQDKIDVIFIDGRFRICCCIYSILKVLQNNWKGVTFMIHDFWNREEYKVLLTLLDEITSKSTLGVFKVKPDLNIEHLKDMLEKYSSVVR